MAHNRRRVIYWTPRILSIIFIIFLALFSLDVISPELSLREILIGLFMHNIPVLLLVIILIAAWRYEIIGGIAFITAGLIYIILTARSGIPWHLALSWGIIIAGPAFLIGILFIVNWTQKGEK